MTKRLFLGVVGIFLSFSLVTLVYAAVAISNQTGDIRVTMADGTQVTVSAGEAMPEIPDGAIIEVISGSADISTTGSSYVEVIIAGDTIHLGAGDAIVVSVNPNTGAGNISLIAGAAVITKADGTTVTLDSSNPTYNTSGEPVAEGGAEGVPEVEAEIQVEESVRDISPSS